MNKINIHNELEPFRKIIHDIRNIKIFTNENKNFIRELSHTEKMYIIITYDDVIDRILKILDTME